jgi:hypothetical protein
MAPKTPRKPEGAKSKSSSKKSQSGSGGMSTAFLVRWNPVVPPSPCSWPINRPCCFGQTEWNFWGEARPIICVRLTSNMAAKGVAPWRAHVCVDAMNLRLRCQHIHIVALCRSHGHCMRIACVCVCTNAVSRMRERTMHCSQIEHYITKCILLRTHDSPSRVLLGRLAVWLSAWQRRTPSGCFLLHRGQTLQKTGIGMARSTSTTMMCVLRNSCKTTSSHAVVVWSHKGHTLATLHS